MVITRTRVISNFCMGIPIIKRCKDKSYIRHLLLCSRGSKRECVLEISGGSDGYQKN